MVEDTPTEGPSFNPEDYGRYICPICQAPHDTAGDKKRHMKEAHSGG